MPGINCTQSWVTCFVSTVVILLIKNVSNSVVCPCVSFLCQLHSAAVSNCVMFTHISLRGCDWGQVGLPSKSKMYVVYGLVMQTYLVCCTDKKVHNIYIHEKGMTCKQTTDCKTCRTVWLLPHVGTADRQPYCGLVKANNQRQFPWICIPSCVCVSGIKCTQSWVTGFVSTVVILLIKNVSNSVMWVSFSGARLTLLLDCFLLADIIFDLFMICWFVNQLVLFRHCETASCY